jgi:hypothetical protein
MTCDRQQPLDQRVLDLLYGDDREKVLADPSHAPMRLTECGH